MGGVKWAFVVTFAKNYSLLAAHSGDVPSWLCRNGIDEKPKYKILMKKRLTLFSLLLLFTMTAMAQTLVDGIYYNLNGSDNTAGVTSGTEYSGDIVIPASISVDGVDYSVTAIGVDAFKYCSGLTSIEMPNSVTSIESASFAYCTSLDSIYIPSQVSEIGSWVFAHCDSLSIIIVAPDNSIFDSRDNCNGIIETNTNTFILGCKTSKIPDSITGIADYAFDDCSLLTTLTIPGSVSYIGSYAFYKCSSLTTLTIESMFPPSVGTAAFNYCNSLITICVPVGAAEAYNVAPWNTYNIVEQVEIINPMLVGGLYYNIDVENKTAEVVAAPSDTKYSGNIVVPASILINGIEFAVSSIEQSAFSGCSNLTSITMQRFTPPTAGTGLFESCNKLETIYVYVGASEAYNVAPWNAYNIVDTEPYYEPRHNGRKTRSDRNVTAVKLTGESSGEQVYTLTSAERNKDYTDVTASVVFQVEPGEELTPKVEQLSDWMHHAVYIDKDKNGFTGAIAAGSEWKPAGDLVSYSFYNNDAADDDKGWNSVGEVLDWSMVVYPPLPTFTAPTEPGIYRMRFVQDWCSIDPAGDADGKFGDFKENGGQIVDVMLEVLNHVYLTDGEAYTNATEKETERIFYTREFNNTQWQSWYVPFDMDYNDISDEYTAACLNDIHEYDDDEDGVLDRWTMEVLILRPGETMYANLPYVIRAKEVGEKQFVVENTMLYPADEQSMDCSSMRMHYTFTGTYSPIEAQVLRDNGWLAMGNGRLVTPTTTSTLKANRWYLESTPRKGYGSTYQAPKRIELVVVDENGEVTGVEELPLTEDKNAVWPADVYDLNGRLVKAQAKNLNELPKGVYVVNRQKWVK